MGFSHDCLLSTSCDFFWYVCVFFSGRYVGTLLWAESALCSYFDALFGNSMLSWVLSPPCGWDECVWKTYQEVCN